MTKKIKIKDTKLEGIIIGAHQIFNLYIVKFDDNTIKEVSPHLVEITE